MWQGTVALRPAGRSTPATQALRIGTETPRWEESGATWQARAAASPPGAEHGVGGGWAGLLAWIDDDGTLGQALTAQVRRTGLPVNGQLVEAGALDESPPHPALRATSRRIASECMTNGQKGRRVGRYLGSAGWDLFADELGLTIPCPSPLRRPAASIAHAWQGATSTAGTHCAAPCCIDKVEGRAGGGREPPSGPRLASADGRSHHGGASSAQHPALQWPGRRYQGPLPRLPAPARTPWPG